MARQFARFTKAQFELALDAIAIAVGGVASQEVTNSRSEEFVYRISLAEGRAYARIFSSVSPVTGWSRDNGDDAIRVNLIRTATDRPMLPRQAYVQRIDTWARNLAGRVGDLARQASELLNKPAPIPAGREPGAPCRECGGPTYKMASKFGPGTFDACPNFRAHPAKVGAQ